MTTLVRRPVPTLIHDGKAWVEAVHYDQARTDNDYIEDEARGLRSQLAGSVCLTDAEWDRVVWWLLKPVPPGPAKALDEAILRKINAAREQQA